MYGLSVHCRKTMLHEKTRQEFYTNDDITGHLSYRTINTIALRKAKIAYNFGLSECNRVK